MSSPCLICRNCIQKLQEELRTCGTERDMWKVVSHCKSHWQLRFDWIKRGANELIFATSRTGRAERRHGGSDAAALVFFFVFLVEDKLFRQSPELLRGGLHQRHPMVWRLAF